MCKIYFYVPSDRTKVRGIQDPNDLLGFHDRLTSEIIQPYLYLKKAGLDCEMVEHIPNEGILVSDHNSFNQLLGKKNKYFGDTFAHPMKVMIVSTKSDERYYPPAHINIVLNPADFERCKNPYSIWNPYYLPFFPQPGLSPRLQERNCLVQNIAYFGHSSQLAKEFQSEKWHNAMTALECSWRPIFEPKQWGNYKNIDVVVAIRNFNGSPYFNKPANKLINCWRMGVPAIVTPESSVLAQQESDLDFILVNSLDETISAIKKLKTNPTLYSAMVNNGLKRAEEFTVEKITQQWINFFEEFALPIYEQWKQLSTIQKESLFWIRYLRFKWERQRSYLKF